jgi:ABC-2 type transport system permease protein
MTAALVAGPLELRQSTWQQIVAMTRRSLLGRLRQPATMAPPIVFPIFFAALSASSFSATTSIPGFPEVDSFLHFGVASAIVQGILFGATTGASDLATDIQLGFFERLLVSPVSRISIIVGRLAASVLVAMAQALLFVLVFWPFNAPVKGGVIGVVGVVVSAGLIALAVAGLLSAFAIRSGSAEAVQGAFPLVFILLFLSSAFFPRQRFTGWYQRVADLNPISHIVEGMRSFVIDDGIHAGAFVRAWGIPALLSVASIGLCLHALRRRLADR